MSSRKDNKNLSSSISPEREERLRNFMENSTDAIYCVEFTEPIAVDLPEDEQIELIKERAYIAEANDGWARSVGLRESADLIRRRLKDIVPFSIPENIEALRQIIRAGYNLNDVEQQDVYQSGESRWWLNNVLGVIENGSVVRVWGVGRDITERKVREKQLLEDNELAVISKNVSSLTPREYEVMTHVITGQRNKEVARALGIAESTVKIHRRRVMEKLEISSIAELVRLCETAGIKPAEAARE